MSRIVKVKKKCAVCGEEHIFPVVLSTNAIGYMDLDTRAPQMRRSCLPYEIQRCPKCNYSNSDLEVLIPGFHRDILQMPAYQTVVNDLQIDSIAKSFLLAGYLYAKTSSYKEAGMCFLKAAWLFDDLSQNNYAIRARKKAIEYLGEYVNKAEDLHLTVLIVDLYRRTDDFDNAKDLAKELTDYGVEEFLNKILQFEIQLCDARDDLCHNVEEISCR